MSTAPTWDDLVQFWLQMEKGQRLFMDTVALMIAGHKRQVRRLEEQITHLEQLLADARGETVGTRSSPARFGDQEA